MRKIVLSLVLSVFIIIVMLIPTCAYAKPSRMLSYAVEEGYEIDSFHETMYDPFILSEARTSNGWEVLSPLTPEYPYLGNVGQRQTIYTLDMIPIDASNLTYDTDVFGFDPNALTFKVHGQGYGWSRWYKSGETAGKKGKRIEAVKLKLDPKTKLGKMYDIYYRAHCQTYGWLNWAKNGQTAGTTKKGKRLEALQILLIQKNKHVPAKYKGITSKYKDSAK